MKYPVPSGEDPHLRSTMHMLGYTVWDGGDIGRIEGFVMDEADWHIAYLDVQGGGWIDGRSVLLPTELVQSVSWAQFRVYMHHTRAALQ